MEAVIFCGIPASGKSSYYIAHYFNTHLRISLDLLNTRNKERHFLQSCIAIQQKFVVDNTNPTAEDRLRYIEFARTAKYRVKGVYFETSLEDALLRNEKRTGKNRIPDRGVRAIYSKLAPPVKDEGFDELIKIRLGENGFIEMERI